MNRPALYHKFNEVQKCISEKAINKYTPKLQWHYDGLDTLIDVGTGTGNVLMDFMRPELPKTFKRLVGADISDEAISFAQNFYRSQKKCEFCVLDIGMEQELPDNLKEKFDHVTSFSCLHWVHNQEQALKNIYQLLKPEGGDCLLTFAPYLPIFDIYEALKDSPTWSPYIGHTDYFAGPLQRITEDKLLKLVQDAGFHNVQVDITFDVYDYESAKQFTDHMGATCMFMQHIPASLHEKVMVDFLEIARRLGCRASSPCGNKCKYSLNFTSAVVYAKKFPIRR